MQFSRKQIGRFKKMLNKGIKRALYMNFDISFYLRTGRKRGRNNFAEKFVHFLVIFSDFEIFMVGCFEMNTLYRFYGYMFIISLLSLMCLNLKRFGYHTYNNCFHYNIPTHNVQYYFVIESSLTYLYLLGIIY